MGYVSTFYCTDPTCNGAYGVHVVWHDATEFEPGEWDRDTCPDCGRELPAVPEGRIYTDAMLEAYMAELDNELVRIGATDTLVYPYAWKCNSRRVFRVIHEELMRQVREGECSLP